MRMLLALLLAAPFACADDKPWKGEQVYSKQRKKETTFGDRVGDKDVTYEFSGSYPLKVLDETSDKLRVHDGKHEGWVLKEQFVRAAEAPGYYADRVKAKPDDAFAIFMLGALAREKGDIEASIRHFTECIRLEPGELAHYYARGGAWILRGDKPKAIKDFDEVIRLDPQNVRAFVARGNARSNGDEHDKAVKDFNEAIRLDPQHVPAYHGRAEVWRRKNDHVRALQDCHEAVRLDPKLPLSYVIRADHFISATDYALAAKDCDEAIRLDPKCGSAYLVRATAHRFAEEYATVVADCEKAVELGQEAQLFMAHFLACCPDAKYRDGTRALKLAEALRKTPGRESLYDIRSLVASALAETGDFAGAVREQRLVITELTDKKLPGFLKENEEKKLKLYEDKKPYRGR